jgi:peptidoglycan/xylan/chitin deacetylase (PgdA/CDA1 family)
MLAKVVALASALQYWTGLAGSNSLRGARILTIHGTPRRRAAELERQLRYVRRQFRVVPLAQLVDGLHARADLDRMVALTFDDGLRNNVEVAYPMLRRLGLPATFFICPGLIEEGRWLWTHEMRRRLRSLEPADRQQPDRLVEWMKRLGIGARREVEDAVREATPRFVPSAAERHEFGLAGWDELRRLEPGLISIGSHTLSHPVLPSMGPDEVELEIHESRRLIEQRLGRPAEVFAYPNDDHNGIVRDLVRRHYRAAVAGGEHKAIGLGADRHILPRVCVPRGVLRLALAMHRAHLASSVTAAISTPAAAPTTVPLIRMY